MPGFKEFIEVNTASRGKRAAVPDKAWEPYKESILQELRAGSSFKKVEKWIEDQKIPGFSPRYVVCYLS
jgi:hypothetical protein